MIPIQPMATYSPGKKKKYFRITFEVGIPDDAIIGQNALTDFGGYLVLRLPKNRIESKFLKTEPELKLLYIETSDGRKGFSLFSHIEYDSLRYLFGADFVSVSLIG